MDELDIITTCKTHPAASTAPVPIVEIWSQICINSKSMCPNNDFVADLTALNASARSAGDYYVWNCFCGLPACTGITTPVVVTHYNDVVSWLVIDVPGIPDQSFTFQLQQYRAAIEKALQETKILYMQHIRTGALVEVSPDPLLTGLLPLIT